MASELVVLAHDSGQLVTWHGHVVETAIVSYFGRIVNRFQRIVVGLNLWVSLLVKVVRAWTALDVVLAHFVVH